MKNESNKKYIYNVISVLIVIFLSISFFFVLLRFDAITNAFYKVMGVLSPFIIGAAIAYIMAPVCNMIEKAFLKILKKIKNESRKESIAQGMGVFFGMVIFCVIIYVIVMVIVPQIINSIVKLVQIMPDSVAQMIQWLQDKLAANQKLLGQSRQLIDKVYGFIQNWMSNDLLSLLQDVAGGLSTSLMNVFTFVMDIIMGLIVAIYMLISRKKLLRQFKLVLYSIFKKETSDSIKEELKFVDKVFSGFINGKIVDSAIVAVLCYIGMMVFRVFSSSSNLMSEMLIAVIIGVFNIIPFFGWYVGLILAALFTLMVNPAQCIYLIIFDIILMQIDANVISPKILGNTTGLSSFWVLFAILFFGGVFGFFGMLIGVPIFAVIYHFIKKLVTTGLKKRGRQDMLEEYDKEYPAKEVQ